MSICVSCLLLLSRLSSLGSSHGDGTCHGDELSGIFGDHVVEEGLGSFAQLGIFQSDQIEGALDHIGAVNDVFGGACHTLHSQNLDAFLALHSGEGSIADGVFTALDGCDDGAGGGQLLLQDALIGGLGDGLEAVAGAGAGFTADAGDFALAAEFSPVGDFAVKMAAI